MKLRNLVARNCKLFFRDRSLSVTAFIAPLILLFLFVAFLGDVYRDSLTSVLQGAEIEKKLVEGFASGWLVSSLMAVSAISISFTANLIMVQDKITGRISDLTVAPVAQSTLALGYYLSTALVTLGICYLALGVGFIWIAISGWYLSVSDVFLTLLDVLLLVLFGTALSSIVCRFVKSQGGITAVELIVSAAYGFLCGAYMPISSLAKGLADFLSILPGTYGTVLLHEHLMGGAIDKIGEVTSSALADGVREGFDCKLSVFGNTVPEWGCYLVLGITVAVLIAVFLLLCFLPSALRKRKNDGIRQ